MVDLKLLGVVDELQPIILKSVHDNLSKGSEIQGYPTMHVFKFVSFPINYQIHDLTFIAIKS